MNTINYIKNMLIVDCVINKLDILHKKLDVKIKDFSTSLFHKYEKISFSFKSRSVEKDEFKFTKDLASIKRLATVIKVAVIGLALLFSLVLIPVFSPIILMVTALFNAYGNFTTQSNPNNSSVINQNQDPAISKATEKQEHTEIQKTEEKSEKWAEEYNANESINKDENDQKMEENWPNFENLNSIRQPNKRAENNDEIQRKVDVASKDTLVEEKSKNKYGKNLIKPKPVQSGFALKGIKKNKKSQPYKPLVQGASLEKEWNSTVNRLETPKMEENWPSSENLNSMRQSHKRAENDNEIQRKVDVASKDTPDTPVKEKSKNKRKKNLTKSKLAQPDVAIKNLEKKKKSQPHNKPVQETSLEKTWNSEVNRLKIQTQNKEGIAVTPQKEIAKASTTPRLENKTYRVRNISITEAKLQLTGSKNSSSRVGYLNSAQIFLHSRM
jgi:hypothetical protein